MKSLMNLSVLVVFVTMIFLACSPKYGCPSNGNNIGAEKHLDGSKVPKAKKFRA